MTMQVVRLIVSVAAMALWARAALAADPEMMTWKIDGETRRAMIYLPSVDSSGRSPVIFAFHGRGDNVQNFQSVGLHLAWPEAIVVYFQGLSSRRDGAPGWQVEKGQDDDRDLKLVDAALTSLRKIFGVDDARIYATGFSNGAGFTYLLWAERPAIFAAFAPVSGQIRPSVQPTQPKPVFHIAGAREASFTAQQKTIEAVTQVDGVANKGEPCGNGCTLYGPASPTPVMTWVHPGGHEYPADTSDRIAKFFLDHPLKR
jgi:polyhydroxybutyrate depolymerase